MITDIKASDAGLTVFAQVSKMDVRQDKRGRPYLMMTLSDCTGAIEARYWDNGTAVPVGTRMKVQAEVSEYNGELQLKVLRWRCVEPSDGLDDGYFLRASKHDRADMLTGVYSMIGMIRDTTLSSVVESIVRRYAALLKDAPAAKSNHQPYLGGLLEHIHALGKLVFQVCDLYSTLDRDVLLASAILHDIGKVLELETTPVVQYTRRGLLVGHIVLGFGILSETRAALASDRIDHLEHIIASHHGQRDWGSPVEPMSREAMVFHQLDMIDSRMGLFDELKFNGAEFLTHKGRSYWKGPDAERAKVVDE